MEHVMQVKPTPPPVFSPPLSTSPPTRAQQMRSAAIRAAMQHAEARRESQNGSSSKRASRAKRQPRHAQHANSRDVAQVSDLQHSGIGGAAEQGSNSSTAVQSAAVSSAACNESGSALSAAALQADAPACVDSQQNDSHVSGLQQDSLQNSYNQMHVDAADVVRLVAIHVRSELTESHFDM